MSELFGSTVTDPIEKEPRLSVMHLKLVPPSVVFHKPPAAAATYHTLRLRGSMAMAAIRPEVSVGPMERKASSLHSSEVSGVRLLFPCKRAPVCWLHALASRLLKH